MNVIWIVLIVIVAVLAALAILFYFLGKKAEKKRAEQQVQIDANSQTVSMLIIDKKRLPLKKAGLPDMVIEQTPWYMRRSKIPVVKAKVGPKIMTLIADAMIYDDIPVKKEVKAVVSGMYITGVRGLRNNQKTEPEKKGFFARMRQKAKSVTK